MLSVSGLRGIVAASLTPDVAVRYAQALATWLLDDQGAAAGDAVVVGRDSRPSGEMIEAAVVAGLLSMGLVPRRAGIVSTPAAALAVKRASAAGGIVITASHNPAPWNGIKPIRRDATAPPPDDAQRIIDAFHAQGFATVDATAIHGLGDDVPALAWHVDAAAGLVDAEAIATAKLKAVVDATCGAGGPEVAALLDRLGVEAILLHAEPTGAFPHAPEPTRENLGELCDAVTRHAAHVGLAVDPDADRLALVDEQGRYLGEEYTLALAAQARLRSGDTAAANLSTSRMIDDIADGAGATVVRTPVGEAHVAAAMRDQRAAVGGEGNGGVIVPELTFVRDSLAGMALVLEHLARRGEPLSAVAASIPAYAIVKDKRPRPDAYDAQGLARRLGERFPDTRIDTRDGVRLDWADAWMSVRASNTEPILRLIAEAPSEDRARAMLADAAGVLDAS